MKYRDFTKMYDLEVEKLLSCPPPAWGTYHIIKRCAFVDKIRERSYWSFPSQLYISKKLGFQNEDDYSMTGNQRKKIRQATEKLIECGLIRVHRDLKTIDKKKAIFLREKNKKEAKRLNEEWKTSSAVRDMLVDWGRLRKGSSASVLIYELIALRDIELIQVQSKNVPVNGEDLDCDDLDLDLDNPEKYPKEEKHSLEELNNKSIIEEENIWEINTISSKYGNIYSRSQIEDMLNEDLETTSKLILSAFASYELETIASWLTELETKMEIEDLLYKVSMKILGL